MDNISVKLHMNDAAMWEAIANPMEDRYVHERAMHTKLVARFEDAIAVMESTHQGGMIEGPQYSAAPCYSKLYCQYTMGGAKKCCGLSLLVCQHRTRNLNEVTSNDFRGNVDDDDSINQHDNSKDNDDPLQEGETSTERRGKKWRDRTAVVLEDEKRIPFKVVLPLLAEITQFFSVLNASHVLPQSFVEFQTLYVPYFNGTSNGYMFRSRKYNDAPGFCQKCFEFLIDNGNFTVESALLPPVELWRDFCLQYFNKKAEDRTRTGHEILNPITGRWRISNPDIPAETKYTIGIASASWIGHPVWKAFVHNIKTRTMDGTDVRAYDRDQRAADITGIVARYTSLNTQTTTIETNYVSRLKIFKKGVPFCIADAVTTINSDMVLLPLKRQVAFTMGESDIRYSNDIHVYDVGGPELGAELVRLVKQHRPVSGTPAEGLEELFPGSPLPEVVIQFVHNVLATKARQILKVDGNKQQQYEMSYDATFLKKDINFTEWYYKVPSVDISLEQQTEFKRYGHHAVIALMPFGDGAWTRIFPEAPIDATCSSAQKLRVDEKHKSTWSQELPYMRTPALEKILVQKTAELVFANKFARKVAADEADSNDTSTYVGEKKRKRQAILSGANIETPTKVINPRKKGVLKSPPRRPQTEVQKMERNMMRKSRAKGMQENGKVAEELTRPGGAMGGAFMYINSNNVVFMPMELFYDADIRTAPNGNKKILFVIFLENRNAEKPMNEILGVSGRRMQCIIEDKTQQKIPIPMKESACYDRTRNPGYAMRVAKAKQNPWFTEAALKFAEEYIM